MAVIRYLKRLEIKLLFALKLILEANHKLKVLSRDTRG